MSQLNLFDGPCEYCRTHSEEVLYSAEDGPCVHKKAENASRDCYSTPDRIYLPLHEEFQFTIDAAADATNHKCPLFFSEIGVNALYVDWYEQAKEWGVEPRFWLNPAYSYPLIEHFMSKAYEAYHKGALVVCLVCPSVCSGWWHKYVLPVITPGGIPIPTAENLALPSDRQRRGEGGGYLRFFESRINFVPPSGVSTKGGNDRDSVLIVMDYSRLLHWGFR